MRRLTRAKIQTERRLRILIAGNFRAMLRYLSALVLLTNAPLFGDADEIYFRLVSRLEETLRDSGSVPRTLASLGFASNVVAEGITDDRIPFQDYVSEKPVRMRLHVYLDKQRRRAESMSVELPEIRRSQFLALFGDRLKEYRYAKCPVSRGGYSPTYLDPEGRILTYENADGRIQLWTSATYSDWFIIGRENLRRRKNRSECPSLAGSQPRE